MAFKTYNQGSAAAAAQSGYTALGVALTANARDLPVRFQFWRGASAKRYVHTVFHLLMCPELPKANIILVRLDADGTRTPLWSGRTTHTSGTLNRAEIRQKAAQIGANEVHVHMIGDTEQDRLMIDLDLRAGLFSTLSNNPAQALLH